MPTYFISGHLDLTRAEFDEHYVPQIDAALAGDAKFVVGDARGADCLAQMYLSRRKASARVFHMLEGPRNNSGFPTVGGFQDDGARDAAMTAASDADIAWVRPGREKSGTARNLQRRDSLQKPGP